MLGSMYGGQAATATPVNAMNEQNNSDKSQSSDSSFFTDSDEDK